MSPTYDPLTNRTSPDTEAANVATLAKQAAEPTDLAPGTVYLVANADGVSGSSTLTNRLTGPGERPTRASSSVTQLPSRHT